MRTFRMGLLAAFVLACAGHAWAEEPAAEKPADAAPKAKVGAAAPDFELKDSSGKPFKLSDHKDKIVVLEWVNQECPWSRKVVPLMQKLTEKYKDNKKVVFVAVESTAKRTDAENTKYIEESKLPYAGILMDQAGTVGHMYGAKTTPHMFVIKEGTLIYAGALTDDQHEKKPEAERRNFVDEALSAALEGKAPPATETQPWGCSVKYAKKSK